MIYVETDYRVNLGKVLLIKMSNAMLNYYFDNLIKNKETTLIKVGGYKIAIASLPVAIPNGEVEEIAAFNYFWQNGVEDASKHKGHIIVSMLNAGKNLVLENLLYSKIASAILNNSQSIGMYIGGRTLAISKDFYQDNVETMSEKDLPLFIWIYFGLRQENGKNTVYTYGLADFGKKEMEIVDSDKSFEVLNEMMFNLAHYVVAYDVTLRDGETIGLSSTQKLKITESKSRYLEGNTLKIEY